MKILVISDTHGDLTLAKKICKMNDNNFDLIVHAGDFLRDGLALGEATGIPVKAVKGNSDGSTSSEDYLVFEVEFGRIYLAHGHFDIVNYKLEYIIAHAKSLDCKAAIFGHTHVGLFQEEDGIYLLNPGSLSIPKDGKPHSYAIITTDEKGMTGNILYMKG